MTYYTCGLVESNPIMDLFPYLQKPIIILVATRLPKIMKLVRGNLDPNVIEEDENLS